MNLMRSVPLTLLCGLVLLGSAAGADNVPNFRNMRELEKKGRDTWVSQVCVATIKAARTSAKNASADRHELMDVEGKPNRKELHIKGLFYGVVSGTQYKANIVLHLDTREKNIWEVVRIDYDDNSPNVLGPNRKNLEKLRGKFNGE
jgi:hypothetical protein